MDGSLTFPSPADRLHDLKFRAEHDACATLAAETGLSDADRATISARAETLVTRLRAETRPTMMEAFLGEYGLSTREGVALMCLAEAMLRVPDAATIDDLIEDKIVPSDWGRHRGTAASSLVNASTWALMLTGRVLEEPHPGLAGTLRGAVKRLGEPVIRTAVGQAMREMGRQFVLGQTIDAALSRACGMEAKGYTYSYDMLGEAAMTAADAERYRHAYTTAMDTIAQACTPGAAVADNPGISVKISALHPRYEVAQADSVLAEVVPVLRALARQARAANMGFNVDAEEQDRLELSLRIIAETLRDPELAGWDGFGVVVQAYGKRAGAVIDWLHETARALDRRLMVRLVKGAYWDTEVKHAQTLGLPEFPVFTSKTATDVNFLACAAKLVGYADRLYPQFATHNAHSVAAIQHMAQGISYEFQRLHGMGERLYDLVRADDPVRCRIYAPVGAHRDLLAYLVRRLLENGANSSFVNQITDTKVPPARIAADPITALRGAAAPEGLAAPAEIFGPGRRASAGFDLTDSASLARIRAARDVAVPDAAPILADATPGGPSRPVKNPATGAVVAHVTEATEQDVATALDHAAPWDAPAEARAEALRQAADLYERAYGPLFAALAQEAGKTLPDAVAELREAVDFLRYYAGAAADGTSQLGRVTAISPWNFPLAIFTGQIAAALAAGNAVLAKPAEQTPLVAAMAVRLLHEAGVPPTVLQLLPGDGASVGAALCTDARIDGVVFTGSTGTAQTIRRAMADHLSPGAPLIAETGGLNAMVVDSTALPEQAVRDILASSFQSAGQRCSALRCLYVQEDVATSLTEMIVGAMDALRVGDPWALSTDVGPVIDGRAQAVILAHIETARQEGRITHQVPAPEDGTFVPPTLIRVPGIGALEGEVFGPVLHIATFKAAELTRVIDEINATGYGLTFGLHSRIDARVQEVAERIAVGNTYINRNQIGAVVGSQPFGGGGLSGTGPKAGGPHYVGRFLAAPAPVHASAEDEAEADLVSLRASLAEPRPAPVLETLDLPGPTGESNRLSRMPRAPVLCLGPGEAARAAQVAAVADLGGHPVAVTGRLDPDVLRTLTGFAAMIYWGEAKTARAYGQALAARPGPILPLITGAPDVAHVTLERHLCVDTTAAGGNAALLAGAE